MTFSFDTIDNFDKHIALSIPNYKHIHELIYSLATYFIKSNTSVYDLGCSTGSLIEQLACDGSYNKIKGVDYIGYDNSDNMERKLLLARWMNADITCATLDNASLITSIFTLQFLSIKDRCELVNRIYKNLNKGGAFIVCEKVYIRDGFMQDLFTFSYYDYKKRSFTEKEILDKQKDLRSIMNPFTEEQNKLMFREAGFSNIETFFSSLMFKGWVLVK